MTALTLELSDGAVEWLKKHVLGLSLTRGAEELSVADQFLVVLAKAVMNGARSVRLERSESSG